MIRDRDNGLLFDFFSAESLAKKVDEALRRQRELQPLRSRARRTIVERYDLRRVCLPAQVRLVDELTGQAADARAAAR